MEGRTENFTPGGQSLPLGAKLRMGLWAQADLTIFQMLWRILRHLRPRVSELDFRPRVSELGRFSVEARKM
jgi:hypothetical protein